MLSILSTDVTLGDLIVTVLFCESVNVYMTPNAVNIATPSTSSMLSAVSIWATAWELRVAVMLIDIGELSHSDFDAIDIVISGPVVV